MRYTSLFNRSSGAEWVPPMLKPAALVSLAVLSFAVIAALEILRHYTVAQVLSPNNGGILFSARYLPTLVFIALGYIVKGVASDLKKVTPWANMSGRWASGSHTVLLDYISALEIVAVFSAMRRKDWAVFIGLVCTFICGALVPLANALAYVDLFAPRNITATFTQTSAFRFDNSPLVMANGSLTIPWNTTGTEPYARAISGRLGGAPRTLWTAGNYAFDQFSVPSVPNATATTEVNSIAAGLDCQRLRYSDRVVPDIVGLSLEASPDDLEAAGCNAGLEIEAFISPQPDDFSYPRAWLNITQCSDHADDGDSDRRILATYLSYFERPNGTIYYNGSSVTGLLCSPRFTSQMARLSVNSTTSEITAFEVSSEPQPLDIKTSTEALWIYLQNPLDSDIQKMFGRAQLVGSKGVYDPATRPVANMANITYAMEFDLLQRDPFMQVALQGHPENVFIGHDVFQREVTEFAGKVWAEVISFLARSEASNELPGRIAVTDERILLRNPVVRTCQALLAFLGIVAILCALRGRPKTVLEQDPGSLAAASVILSASDAAVEREMAKHSLKSTQEMATDLRSTRFMLRKRNAGQQPGVTVDLTRGPTVQDPEEMVDMNGYQPAPEDRDSEGKGASLDGWRPLPLRLVSKVALEVAAAAVMIGLGIMLWQSDKQNGLCVDTPVSSAALTLSASTVLVIFGYCFAGVDAAAQAQAPFNVLRKRPNNLTIFTDDLTLLGRLSGLGSGWMNITLLASAASYILIIPAMKLVAAGLFSPVNTQVVDAVSVQPDTSMTTHLEQVLASPSINRTPVIKQACDFAEWETNPVFNLRPRPGIVGNLVLDNLTAVVGTKDDIPGSVIEARVPAIAVDIQCEPTPSSDFNLSLSRAGDHAQGMKFAWACTTERCDKLNSLPGGFFAQTDALSGEIPSYSGEVSFSVLNESSAKQSDGIPASGSVYSMYIADLTSLGGSTHSFRNMTPLPSIYDDEDENTTLWATPDTLNVTLPPVVATHCRRNLTIVDVNATFTRPTAVAIESGAHLLPWRPISIDVGSIQYARPFPDLQPEYFQPPRVEFAVWGQVYDDDLIDGKLQSNSLWPARGSSQNFYELLAADAQHRAGNLSRLLTPAGLADSATRMYTAYCTQILSELRTFASNDTSLTPSAANQTQTVPARLVHSQLRVHQDAKTTYILLALLGTVACFALLVFCRFPSAAILPKEPGSIASRFSLLADSTLVRQLRQDKVSDVNEMRKWREPAALGWWRNIALTGSDMSDRSSTSTSTSGWRWGVDIGQHAILQSWKDPPNSPHPPAGSSLGSPSPSQSSTPSSLDSTPMLPELPFQRGVDEVPVTEMNSQQSSVSSIDIDILHDRYREHPSESDTFSPDSELYT